MNDSNLKKETFSELENYKFPTDLEYNDHGKDVLALQDFLRDLNYYPHNNSLNNCPINGNFRSCTENSLRKFQQDNGLNTTGYLDIETRKFVNLRR